MTVEDRKQEAPTQYCFLATTTGVDNSSWRPILIEWLPSHWRIRQSTDFNTAALTNIVGGPNIFLVHDRVFVTRRPHPWPLSHSRTDRRRRHGCCLQGSRRTAGSQRCSESPSCGPTGR